MAAALLPLFNVMRHSSDASKFNLHLSKFKLCLEAVIATEKVWLVTRSMPRFARSSLTPTTDSKAKLKRTICLKFIKVK
jgi:hypothetical protein